MDFGKIVNIDDADFTLPADNATNKKILNKKNYKKTKVYIGCAKWGRTEWVGKIYPAGTKEKDFLEHYVKNFNCIELNTTHYRIYKSEVVQSWQSKAPKDFIFCPKFPQVISHFKRLKECEAVTEYFYKSISSLKENLGDCFLQLPPNFAPKSFDVLRNYLEWLPKLPAVTLELRHPGWFNDKTVFDETFKMLRETGIGSVITDAAGRRDVVHMRLSGKTAFIRFVGNDLHPTDYTRVDEWVKRLKKWMNGGLEKLYFMMHMTEEINSPELCAYAVKQFNKQCKLKLIEPGISIRK